MATEEEVMAAAMVVATEVEEMAEVETAEVLAEGKVVEMEVVAKVAGWEDT